MAHHHDKLERLKTILRDMGKVAVAYSGGADSTFLLRIARDELGAGVIAVMNVNELISEEEVRDAVDTARKLGIEPVIVRVDIFSDPDLLANRPDRCYICKRTVFGTVKAAAGERGFHIVADGSHAGDLDADRPGKKALRELGIRSPLAEAGLDKGDIRSLSHRFGMATAEKPSNPCLATRIPFYEPITVEKLKQVERAERVLRDLDIKEVRVRHHGTVARIEVLPSDFEIVMEKREAIVSKLKELGFVYVDLDLQGFRSGSMSEAVNRS